MIRTSTIVIFVLLATVTFAGQDPPRKPNRLASEKSPYLLQHAHNPVDWFPWGNEALEKARSERKPIFLSIGYSTCHWCHVMERETFENQTIANYLNEHFVSIKVDREERPDVDQVYMAFCIGVTGSGGWPLTAFLTPERKPFFAGSYFPPTDDLRRGRGFFTLIQQINKGWKENPIDVLQQAEHFTDYLKKAVQLEGEGGELKPEILKRGFEIFRSTYDVKRGGFGSPPRFAPKFPRTAVLDFLLRYSATKEARSDGNATRAIEIASGTLDGMIRGGIRDHLGGGFHRYSTDSDWLIPHFEKMLYDQALISRTLCDAWRVTRNDTYREVARETLDYVLARLTSPDGGFYSAEDADTQGVEGTTYTWPRAEIVEILGKDAGERFADFYGASEGGNFHEGDKSSNVLHVKPAGGVGDFAQKLRKPVEEITAELKSGREKLLKVRDQRPQPLRDDKVLAEWNGFAISAFSHVYQITGQQKYLDAARRSATFLLERLMKDGRLLRRFRDGEAAIDAFLEDHAAVTDGLLDLYESSFETKWLEAAIALGSTMLNNFWDPKDGAFFSSGPKNEALFTPTKEFYDGAVPSGNSVAFLVVQRLEELTGDEKFRKVADRMARTAAGLFSQENESTASRPLLLCGAIFSLVGAKEIVICGTSADPLVQRMLEEAQRRFLPARVLVRVESADEAERLSKIIPLAGGKGPLEGKPVAFVCNRGVCKLPSRDLEALQKALSE